MRIIYYATVDASVPYNFYLTCLLCLCVCLLARTYACTRTCVCVCVCVCLCLYTTWSIEKKSFDRPNGRRYRSIGAFVRSFVCVLFEKSWRHDRSIDREDRSSRSILDLLARDSSKILDAIFGASLTLRRFNLSTLANWSASCSRRRVKDKKRHRIVVVHDSSRNWIGNYSFCYSFASLPVSL